MMALAGYKTISILSLIVLVALAGGSPVLADVNGGLSINPPAACPGAKEVWFTGDFAVPPQWVVVEISSDPDGLISGWGACEFSQNEGMSGGCPVSISDDACAGSYMITMTLLNGQDKILASAEGQFTVGTDACPDVPPCPTPPAVGGCVQPVNTFALLAPWLAVIGTVGCITVVVARRRRS